MQKNKNKQFHHRHHVRVSAIAIAIATGCHVSGAMHFGRTGHELLAVSAIRGFHTEIERENETARHMVRFDEGMRLPSTSGSTV